jgi:hypothetical protein
MPHGPHGYVRQDSSDQGWAGVIDGVMGSQDHEIERFGGWPTDGRRLHHRILDLVAMHVAIILGVLALMAALTWLVDH